MKKKVVTLLLFLTFALGVVSCGNAKATNIDVPQAQGQEQQAQAQEVKQEQEEEGQIKEANLDDIDIYSLDKTDCKYFYLFKNVYNVGYDPSREDYEIFDGYKTYAFAEDTKIYDIDGYLCGYIKAGEKITSFMNCNSEIASFWFETEEDPANFYLVNMQDIPDFHEKFTDTDRSDVVISVIEYKPVGGVTPRSFQDLEALQKFVDSPNEYYSPEEILAEIREKADSTEVFENKDEFEKITSFECNMKKDEFDEYTEDEIIKKLSNCNEYYIHFDRAKTNHCDFSFWGK